MKLGDQVICIYDGKWDDSLGAEANDYHDPKKDDILTIDGKKQSNGNTYISFKEIPQLDINGMRDFYNVSAFRKLKKDGTNALSKELAHKITWEENIRNPELQEDEINPRIFTTKEKF